MKLGSAKSGFANNRLDLGVLDGLYDFQLDTICQNQPEKRRVFALIATNGPIRIQVR
ncbi:hypothetical protein [Thalassospira alkalitolerans]|uniref:hypothetical protein n=1 Tax=Thalassospira alkalitolerans TaxID=1293890 RepID=UPI003AA82E67